ENWSDITGANSNNFTVVEGITEPMDYRFKISCDDGNTDYSDIVSVTFQPIENCYCIPSNAMNNLNVFIDNVSTSGALEDIDNSSDYTFDGYDDYSSEDPIVVYPG